MYFSLESLHVRMLHVTSQTSAHQSMCTPLPVPYHKHTCMHTFVHDTCTLSLLCPIPSPSPLPSHTHTHTQPIRHKIVHRCHCWCCDRVSSSECNDIHSWLWSWSDSTCCLPEDIQTNNKYVFLFVNKYVFLFVNKCVFLLVNKCMFLLVNKSFLVCMYEHLYTLSALPTTSVD